MNLETYPSRDRIRWCVALDAICRVSRRWNSWMIAKPTAQRPELEAMSNQSDRCITFDRATERMNVDYTECDEFEHQCIDRVRFVALYEFSSVVRDLKRGEARRRSWSSADD